MFVPSVCTLAANDKCTMECLYLMCHNVNQYQNGYEAWLEQVWLMKHMKFTVINRLYVEKSYFISLSNLKMV